MSTKGGHPLLLENKLSVWVKSRSHDRPRSGASSHFLVKLPGAASNLRLTSTTSTSLSLNHHRICIAIRKLDPQSLVTRYLSLVFPCAASASTTPPRTALFFQPDPFTR